MTAANLCPLCDPTLLTRPRLNWQHYRNCEAHSTDIERWQAFMARQKDPNMAAVIDDDLHRDLSHDMGLTTKEQAARGGTPDECWDCGEKWTLGPQLQGGYCPKCQSGNTRSFFPENAPKQAKPDAAAAPAVKPDTRSIVARMEAAAQLLAERRVSFTEAQERRFLERFAELVDIYEAEYPGEVPPLVRYNKDCRMEIQWPEGFSKKRLKEAK